MIASVDTASVAALHVHEGQPVREGDTLIELNNEATKADRNGRPTESASNTRSSERNVALTITIPLFNGFDHTYRVRQAKAQAQAQRAQMEMVEQQILLEIVRAYSDAQTAWKT